LQCDKYQEEPELLDASLGAMATALFGALRRELTLVYNQRSWSDSSATVGRLSAALYALIKLRGAAAIGALPHVVVGIGEVLIEGLVQDSWP